jgi:hypothetical protein
MIKAFTVSILSLFFFSSVQIAFINENTEGYLGKVGLLKLTRDICIKKGTVHGNTTLSTDTKGIIWARVRVHFRKILISQL